MNPTNPENSDTFESRSWAPNVTLNDGHSMPQLGLGLWQASPEQASAAVRCALAAGYRHIDTATIYGNEEAIGESLAEGPSNVFVTTKVWNSDHGFDRTLRAFDASAAKLRRDVIDLYLIHWAAPRQGLALETWRALIRLRGEGRVKSIGVSNFTPEQLTDVVEQTGVTPAVNQIELHPRFQQAGLQRFNRSIGVATESWSPLGQGHLLSHAVVKQIAARHDKTSAQILIRWHLDQGFIVIPKSVTPTRISENFQVFDFGLSEADMRQLAALDSPSGRLGENPETDF